jgi:hypothetical protein
MWAYPRWYRRERGTEMVTTLLDDARPGQRRPRLVEVLDLLRRGLLTRLWLPRNVGAYLVAAIVALFFAVIGAAAGVLLSPYPGPPREAQAVAVAVLAVGQAPQDVPGPVVHCDLTDCPAPATGDDVVSYDAPPDRTDRVAVSYHPSAAQVSTFVAEARQRLAAAGWRVGPVYGSLPDGIGFDASNGTLNLLVDGTAGSVDFVVSKGFSQDAVIALAAGAGVGLLVGWLLATWLFQRRRLHHGGMRVAIDITGALSLAGGGLVVAETLFVMLVAASSGFTPKDVQLPEFVLTFVPDIFPIAGLALGTGILMPFFLAATPAGRAPSGPAPRGPALGGA